MFFLARLLTTKDIGAISPLWDVDMVVVIFRFMKMSLSILSFKLESPKLTTFLPFDLSLFPTPFPSSRTFLSLVLVQLKMYRKCTVPVVASKGKYGSNPHGTWFQLLELIGLTQARQSSRGWKLNYER